MAFRFLKRKTRVWFLVFCIIVVLGAFAWEKYNIWELSIERLKSMLSDLELLRATVTTEIEFSEDLGVDLSEMDLEDIFAEQGLDLNEGQIFCSGVFDII